MTLRHPIQQTLAIVGLAAVCALVANAAAPKTRQLVLVGVYPNALRVPSRNASTETANRAAPATFAPPVRAAASTSIPESAPPIVTKPAVADDPHPAVAGSADAAPPKKPAPVERAKVTPAAPPAAPAAQPHPTPSHADLSRFSPHPDKAYVEISGADVAALHAAGTLFLDARRTSVYEQGHIAGARSLSVWESDLEEKVRTLFDERSDPREQGKAIVIYCSGGDCEDSHMLAEKLWGIQFNNLYVYKDGFPDWQKRGGAIHKGSRP